MAIQSGFRLIDGDDITNAINQTVATALTATGSTRADALQLAADINVVGTAASGTGVILPLAGSTGIGNRVLVFNGGASPLKVYGAGSDTVDTVAAATGVALANAKRCEYFVTTATTWISAQMGVVSA